MENTQKGRLLTFLTAKSIGKPEFYRRTGLGNAYLDKAGQIQQGKIGAIRKAYPELNMQWVLTGKGDMLLPREDQEDGPVSRQALEEPDPAFRELFEALIAAKNETIAARDRIIAAKDELISVQAATIKSLESALELLKTRTG
ncbi:hypothetical protein [Compostibacter hankyongensis]|uniref:XRE family transcriptional regulator n=1 Tax=Compostibacter hankyongensis TaxID=1007089 RepID=A0ABP8FD75_9BACT